MRATGLQSSPDQFGEVLRAIFLKQLARPL